MYCVGYKNFSLCELKGSYDNGHQTGIFTETL